VFARMKSKVIETIIKNKDREINNKTNNKNVGIYMIYINNFDDDKIIPIYIGQTGCGENRNFQNRYKEHIQEIMALNRLKYDYYKELLFKRFYDGHYKACKIFQYMIEHKCTLKDFKMIVLEEIEGKTGGLQEVLDELEQKYFSEYLPAFFGFNQINTVVELNKEFYSGFGKEEHLRESQKLLRYELDDCENFIRFFGYGYTKFNYYHVFPKMLPFSSKNDEKTAQKIKETIKILNDKHYDAKKFESYEREIPKLIEQKKQLKIEVEDSKNEFLKKYERKIKKYCEDNKIGVIQKYDEIIKMLIYKNENRITDFNKYLKRKKIDNNILDILNKDKNFVKITNNIVEKQKELYDVEDRLHKCMSAKGNDDLQRILPKEDYNVLPLKDKYEEIKFKDVGENTLIINFEFSNNGISKDFWYFTFDLIKMDYLLKINNEKIEKKNIFIKQPEEYDEVGEYFEKDFGDRLKFKKQAFCVRKFPNYISTTMEFKNGINEYTLRDKELVDYNDVLDELNLLINEKTEVQIMVRDRMKSKCKEFIKYDYKKENLIKKKLLEVK